MRRANFRQIARVYEKQTSGGAKQDGTEQQEGQSNTVNQFPTAQTQSDRREAQHRKKILAQMKVRREEDEQVRFQILRD